MTEPIDLSDVEAAITLESMMVRHLGKEKAEEFLEECRQYGVDVENDKMREAGVSEEEIAAFWAEVSPHFIDDNEDHAVDNDGNVI